MNQRNPVRDVYLVTSHPTDRSGEVFDWIDDGVTLDSAAASRRVNHLKKAGIHDEPDRKYFVRTLRFETDGHPRCRSPPRDPGAGSGTKDAGRPRSRETPSLTRKRVEAPALTHPNGPS